jgi:hypothetical protein
MTAADGAWHQRRAADSKPSTKMLIVVGGAGHVDIGHGGTLPIVPVPLATVQVWPAGRLCTVTS